jgi:hypothetical protein
MHLGVGSPKRVTKIVVLMGLKLAKLGTGELIHAEI